MKKVYWIMGIIILIIITLVIILVYPDNSFDFKPKIKQGIYGTALECYGSAEPPSRGKMIPVKTTFKIHNLDTNQTFEIETLENGRYEFKLGEGSYSITFSTNEGKRNYGNININKNTLIKKNIVTRFCPV